MPFTGTFRDYTAGDLIYGWDMHRYFFTTAKKATKPRWMEDFDTPLTSAGSEFGKELKNGHVKFGTVVDKASSYTTKDTTRKCKGGLWWATQVEKKHVHFYLGGLDMDMVIKKTGGITCAELRWVYRYRTNTDVQTYIQFWRPTGYTKIADLKKAAAKPSGYEQCAPPWDPAYGDNTAASTWSAYKPKGGHHINGSHV